jgi:hypothetical protein
MVTDEAPEGLYGRWATGNLSNQNNDFLAEPVTVSIRLIATVSQKRGLVRTF